MPKDSWRNRIVGHRDVPPGDLELNELNFREHSPHQRRVMRELLEESGWLHSVVFNRTTGRIIDGAMRVKLARQRGEATIPVTDGSGRDRGRCSESVVGAGMGTWTLVGGRASSRGGDLRWVMHLASGISTHATIGDAQQHLIGLLQR